MNHLSLHEAEISREQAVIVGKQGQTLMVFTVITVIFTPLSFLTSLFALNISVFPRSGENVVYWPTWVFGIMFGTLIGFCLLVWAAVEISRPDVLRKTKDIFLHFGTHNNPGASEKGGSLTPQSNEENNV
ncbi:hypothetical protein F5X97DRAFT_120187 [Nemania serpens]|nr:hypothetical protein F5X97DRAFT_120187 [Nemania serpens]